MKCIITDTKSMNGKLLELTVRLCDSGEIAIYDLFFADGTVRCPTCGKAMTPPVDRTLVVTSPLSLTSILPIGIPYGVCPTCGEMRTTESMDYRAFASVVNKVNKLKAARAAKRDR